MAQYTINAGCGHRVTQQLYGVERDRRRRIEWMESPSGMCNPCYKAKILAKAKDAAAAASMARTITSDELLAQAKAMARQAEILNHPKAKILAMALTIYWRVNGE